MVQGPETKRWCLELDSLRGLLLLLFILWALKHLLLLHFCLKWFRAFLRGWFLALRESFDSPILISPRQGQAGNGHNTRASVTAGCSDKVTVSFWNVYLCEFIVDLQLSWQEGRCFRGTLMPLPLGIRSTQETLRNWNFPRNLVVEEERGCRLWR